MEIPMSDFTLEAISRIDIEDVCRKYDELDKKYKLFTSLCERFNNGENLALTELQLIKSLHERLNELIIELDL